MTFGIIMKINLKKITYVPHTSVNIDKLLFTLLFLLYLASSLIYFIWATNVIVFMPIMLGLLAFTLVSIRIRKEHIPVYVYIGLLVISFLVSSLVVDRAGSRLFVPFILILSSPGIALMLIRGFVYSWGGYLVFYGLALYFFILILAGIDGSSAMPLMSHNAISIAMLVACISLYIILSMENKQIDLKPALCTLVISIWGIGRSGIISSLILLLGLFLVKIRPKSLYLYFIIFIIAAVFAYLYLDVLCAFLLKLSFFSKAVENNLIRMAAERSPRLILWSNYFENLDIFRLFFGVNVFEDPWPEGEINEYNYHNSFIHLHLQTGFVGLITLVLFIFSAIKLYRTNIVLFILLITLIVRSSTDLFLFFSRFDFVAYFFLFYFLTDILSKKCSKTRVSHIRPLLADH